MSSASIDVKSGILDPKELQLLRFQFDCKAERLHSKLP
jgi:hypothetical protein